MRPASRKIPALLRLPLEIICRVKNGAPNVIYALKTPCCASCPTSHFAQSGAKLNFAPRLVQGLAQN